MKILVTGAKGQLGCDVIKELSKRMHNAVGVDREDMDLLSSTQIIQCIEKVNPDAIIHCAAYTNVDLAEENEELCRRINALATKDIAINAKKLDIPMIYISTDYVFDGKKGIEDVDTNKYIKDYGIDSLKEKYIPYNEEDIPNPINVYGKTKLEGETYVSEIIDKYYIVRTSWVYGYNGNNFVDTMLRLSKNKRELNIIHDQVGSPTYTKNLSIILVDMVESDKYGIYHATNEGYCSWYEFANQIFNTADINIKINPISSEMYKTKAKRPKNSKMSKEKLKNNGFNGLENWRACLAEYLQEI